MNNGMYLVNLGADPEVNNFGEREGRKLRCADNTGGKKSITRWFNVNVSGRDVATADRLKKGDQILVTGELQLEEYPPKKPRYKGEKVKVDVMPWGKIFQVVKSPSFFGGDEDESGEAAADDGTAQTEAPDLGGAEAPTDDLPF
jgi:single-stranded DNA-binding protein